MKIIIALFSLFILSVLGMETEFNGEFESDPIGYNIQESDPDAPLDDGTESQQEAAPREEMETQQKPEDTDKKLDSDLIGYNIQESDPDAPLDDDTESQQEAAPKEEMETQENIDNELDAQQGSCVCQKKVQKVILKSLQSCIDTLNVIESCAESKKKVAEESVRLMSSCSCSSKVSDQLLQSLISCTKAISAYTTCKKTYSSCADIKSNNPRSQSGEYRLTINNRNIQVYCDMGTLCGIKGGWTRLEKLDMTVSSAKCPSSLLMVTQSGTRICTKNKAGCNSVSIPSHGVPYSVVCGRVRGYQKHSLDGFHSHQSSSIDSPYVDGVSITHGSPRKHIWTLAAGHSESLKNNVVACPCNNGATVKPAPFVRKDFYCESGFSQGTKNHFASSDPLWDKKQCRGQEAPCCNRPLLPWFRKSIGYTTTDNIEMRLCSDEAINNENIGIDQYEFYVM